MEVRLARRVGMVVERGRHRPHGGCHTARRTCSPHSQEPVLEISQHPGHRGPVGGDDVLATSRCQRRQQRHRLGCGEREVPAGPPSCRFPCRQKVAVSGMAPLQHLDQVAALDWAFNTKDRAAPAHPPAGPLAAEVVGHGRRTERGNNKHIIITSITGKYMKGWLENDGPDAHRFLSAWP